MKSFKFSGLTMVELLVVIALVVIIFSMATPSFQSFYVKNITSSATNQLMGALIQAKSTASTRNMCVVLCRSTTAESNNSPNNQACVGSNGENWQSGWIIFANPYCDASMTTPPAIENSLIGMSNSINSSISLTKNGSDYIMFSPFGYPRAIDSGFFTSKHNGIEKNRICLSPAGNFVSVAAGVNCP